MSRTINTFTTAQYQTAVGPSAIPVPIEISPESASVFDGDNIFNLPTGTINDYIAEITLGALTAGNYGAYIGAQVFDKITLQSGGNNIVEISDYENVVNAYLASLTNTEFRAQMLTLLGGATPTSGIFYCPLVLLSQFSSDFAQTSQAPLNTQYLSQKLKLILHSRTMADLAAAGATATAGTISIKLLVWTVATDLSNIDNPANYVYPFIDKQIIKSSAIATATATDIDLNALTGRFPKFVMFDKLVTDYSTSHNRLAIQDDISATELRLDGTYYIPSILNTEARLTLHALFTGLSYGTDTLAGSVKGYVFSGTPVPQLQDKVIGGFLDSRKYSSIQLNLTHGAGANANIYFVGFRYATLTIENGAFVKHLF